MSIEEAALVLSASGNVSFVNQAYLNLTGYDEREVLNRRYLELISEDTRTAIAERLPEVGRQDTPLSLEVNWLRKGIAPLRLLCHHHPFEDNGAQFVIVLSNAPAPRHTEVLSDSEHTFRELLEVAPDAMVLVNRAGNIELVNSQTEVVFGFSRQEMLGQPLEILIPERSRSEHVGHRQNYSHSPKVRRMGAALQLYGRRKDGSEFPVEVSLSPFKTATGYLVMSAIRDISDRKIAEDRIRASLHEKEVLLKEVHHRVKNNLQVINSILNLQSDNIDDPLVREVFNDTRSRIRSIALVHERLYQSQDLANINFHDYIESLAADLFRAFGAESRNIKLTLDVRHASMAIDKTINCGLIVNEVLSNSLKYAFPENRQGKIKISLIMEKPGVLTLSVQDDGVGLPPGFDPTNCESLGLKLVFGLSRELGGEGQISDSQGVSFSVSFPE
jgi:PAS domain S-box-containing protein